MAEQRVTQVAIEALYDPQTQQARVSQMALEVLGDFQAAARVSQMAVEVLYGTQVVGGYARIYLVG